MIAPQRAAGPEKGPHIKKTVSKSPAATGGKQPLFFLPYTHYSRFREKWQALVLRLLKNGDCAKTHFSRNPHARTKEASLPREAAGRPRCDFPAQGSRKSRLPAPGI